MYDSILVGTDGSSTAGEAVRQAIALAQATGARLQIVSAYAPVPRTVAREGLLDVREDLQWAVSRREEAEATLADAAERARTAGVPCEVHARQGNPADAILDIAEEQGSDLIVVGNKGLTGASRFLLGSVPNRVSHHAPCSVLIIRTR